MSQPLVFNHHALPFKSADEARAALPEFLRVALKCQRYGYDVVLLDESLDKSWFEIELAPHYVWRNWYDEVRNNSNLKDTVRAFRSLATQQPLLTALQQETVGFTCETGLEGETDGRVALLACHILNTFLLSLPTTDTWCRHQLSIWVLELSDDSGDLSPSPAQLNNIYSRDSLAFHEQALKQCRADQLASGRDLWNKRTTLFPKLFFLENAIGNQLKNWSHPPDILHKAADVLAILNEFVTRWQAGDFADYQHTHLKSCGLSTEVSGESSSVKEQAAKRSEREFWLPTGYKVFCENHAKLRDGYRLHFYPDTAKRKIYIAYLGPHLKL